MGRPQPTPPPPPQPAMTRPIALAKLSRQPLRTVHRREDRPGAWRPTTERHVSGVMAPFYDILSEMAVASADLSGRRASNVDAR